MGSGNSATTDINGHGTHVAGIIGAQGNNGSGISGVCWEVTLVSLRISVENASDGKAILEPEAVLDAIYYASQQGIDILNMSSGGYQYDWRVEDAIYNYPGLFVCSAGNDNVDLDNTTRYPGSYQSPNMLVVGASTENNDKWADSNHGATHVDIFAPGQYIYSCVPSASYSSWSGTSMAAPHVAGVAALALSLDPALTSEELRELILNNIETHPGFSDYCKTSGLLNAYNVVDVFGHVFCVYEESYYDCGTYHEAYCRCYGYIIEDHSYNYSTVSFNAFAHRSYCACGAFASVLHNFTITGSTRKCVDCGYTLSAK